MEEEMEGFDRVGSKIWFRTGEIGRVVGGGVSTRQGSYDEWVVETLPLDPNFRK